MSQPPSPTRASSSDISDPPSDIEVQKLPWQPEDTPQAAATSAPQQTSIAKSSKSKPPATRKSTRSTTAPKRFNPSTMEAKPKYPRVQDIAHMKVDLNLGEAYNIGDEPPNIQGELTPMLESPQEIWNRRYGARRRGQFIERTNLDDLIIDFQQNAAEKAAQRLKDAKEEKDKKIPTLEHRAVKRNAKMKGKKVMTAKDMEFLRLKAGLSEVEDQGLKADVKAVKQNLEAAKDTLEATKDTLGETENTSEATNDTLDDTENTMEVESEA